MTSEFHPITEISLFRKAIIRTNEASLERHKQELKAGEVVNVNFTHHQKLWMFFETTYVDSATKSKKIALLIRGTN